MSILEKVTGRIAEIRAEWSPRCQCSVCFAGLYGYTAYPHWRPNHEAGSPRLPWLEGDAR